MNKLSFNIIGAGAMGHLWTSFLAHHNYETRLYSKKQQPQQILKVKSPLGDFEHLLDYKQLCDWQDADVTLICVKAHQLEQLCQQLKQLNLNPGKLILIMNGMGLLEIVETYLPQMQTVHASTVHGAYMKENLLLHTGNGSTLLGNLKTDYRPEDFSSAIKQLNIALPQVSWNQEHRQAMNLKLIINAIINPLTAISDQPNGCILTNGKLNLKAEALLKELKPLLIKLLPTMDYQQIKQQIERVAQNTQHNISSMLQDVRAKRQTEIDFINGYLVKLACANKLKLDKHSQIIQQIKQLGISPGHTNN